MAFDWACLEEYELTIDKTIDLLNPALVTKTYKVITAQIENAFTLGILDASQAIHRKLIQLLAFYNVSGLASGISVINWQDGFEIAMTSKESIFVEYGTGIVGAWSPHPENPWAYDVNDHGYAGWVYQADDGTYHRTRGMPSRPYFNDLVNWIQSYGIITRSINKRLRKL